MNWAAILAIGIAALSASSGSAWAQSPSDVLASDFQTMDAQAAAWRAKQLATCKKTGAVWIGMDRALLVACLGQPRRTFTTITAAGRREQMVYRSGYVYLTRGIVDAIQTLK